MKKYSINNLFITILILAVATSSLFAEDKNFEESMERGVYQFRHENYDEALVIFKRLRGENPNSSLVAYYLGLTYKRIEDYVNARKHLEASLEMRPKIKGALIELIDLLYRLDETEDAKKWIEIAEEEGIRPARAAFLKGLTLLRSGEYDEAISAFKDAKELDSDLKQSSDYQIGIAYMRMSRFKDAKSVFEDIISLDPHTDISRYAGEYKNAIEKKLEREKPLNLTLRFAFEYDSNVILKPADTSLVTNITDKDDTREVWDFNGDYTLRSPDNSLSLKAGYGLRISKQNDFGSYNMVSNVFSLQPNITFERVLVSFPTHFSHTVVDEKNYVATITTGNVNNIMIGDSYVGQLGIFYKYDDYMRPPYGDEDRSGSELIGTAGLFYFFAKNEGFLNFRYTVNKDYAEGNNWEYWGNKFSGGVLIPVWDRIKFNLQGEVFLQDYDNNHTVYDKKRDDQIYSLTSLTSFKIIKNLELFFQYTYVNNQSNLNIYEYDRHVFSGGVQYKF